MNFKMIHQNFNVLDLDKSLEFYNKALGLTEKRRIAFENEEMGIYFIQDPDGYWLGVLPERK